MIKLSFQDLPILAKIGNFVKAKHQIILLGALEIALLIAVFFLGVITGKVQFRTDPIILEGVTPISQEEILAPTVTKPKNSATGEYVASNRGKMYYPTDCSAGDSLKPENKIYFKTSTEAEAAGYKRSSACP